MCNELSNKKSLFCTIACGFRTSHTNCYKDDNYDTLLSCTGFIDKNDSSFRYAYYYFNNQPVKVIIGFAAATHPAYNAVYYFSNNNAIKITGEKQLFSTEATALTAGLSHTFWYPAQVKRRKR